MNSKLIVIMGLIITILLLTGCTNNRETGIRMIEGKVVKIDYDDIFGGTFTDWRDIIYFDDGTIVWSQERDLSTIELNRTGRFYFDKNYFEYDDSWYKFDNFVRVKYLDDLEI